MWTTRRLAAALAAFLFVAPLAFADKPRRGLQKFDDEATEVKDVSKRPTKMKGWVETAESSDEFDFPWKQVLGALVCFAIAAPFAWRLYSNVNAEIASAKEDKFGDPEVPGPAAPVRVRRKLTGDRPSAGS
jgi:hypothetical protein